MLPSCETVKEELSHEGSVLMHKRKLSAEQKAEIVRLYPEKGESQSSIAKPYGIDETAVQKYTSALFHHPVCCTVYAGGKESGLMGDCSGETKGVPVMSPPDRRTVRPSSAVWTYDSSLA